jgi:glycosyltransferase involved in cell wall biosynthesis
VQLAYAHCPAAEREAAALAARGAFDVVHIEHLRGVALASRLRNVPMVWDAVDSISALFTETARLAPGRGQRMLARLDLGRTRRFEARAPRRFDRVLVTSPRDAQAFVRLAGASALGRIEVMPNGVDTAYFAPDTACVREAIVFSGKLSYHAHTAAALRLVQRVMPRVWARYPLTPVIVAGKDPPDAIGQLTRDPRVEVTGFLGDLRPVFARAALAASPLVYGAGIQNKVLEAMACGVPVVTTPDAGAALGAVAGRELAIADTDEAFAEAICQLLEHRERRQAMGEAGRAYVEREHQWSRLGERLAGVYAAAQADFSARALRAATRTARDTPQASPAPPSPS